MNLINSESTSTSTVNSTSLKSISTALRKPRDKRMLAGGFLGMFAVVSVSAIPSLRQLDLQASIWARQQNFSGDLEKTIQLSEVFAHGSGVITIFLVLLCVDINNRKKLWNVAAYVLVVGVLANIAKYFLPRLRPNSGVEITDIYSTWLPALTGIGRRSSELSFPSGHSATTVALSIALTMIYPRGKWLFATLAMMAMWQRVYSGAHYPSDCLAGAGIALTIAYLWRFTPAHKLEHYQ